MCIRDSFYKQLLYDHYSLGMGLSIASKLEGERLDGCGVVVAQWSEHWRLKPGALGLIPSGCLDVFSSSKLSDVDGVMSSSTVWLLSPQRYGCVYL